MTLRMFHRLLDTGLAKSDGRQVWLTKPGITMLYTLRWQQRFLRKTTPSKRRLI